MAIDRALHSSDFARSRLSIARMAERPAANAVRNQQNLRRPSWVSMHAAPKPWGRPCACMQWS